MAAPASVAAASAPISTAWTNGIDLRNTDLRNTDFRTPDFGNADLRNIRRTDCFRPAGR